MVVVGMVLVIVIVIVLVVERVWGLWEEGLWLQELEHELILLGVPKCVDLK